ncbi:MAG: hypothetical protein HKO77_02415 [Gemmatimonadetes bacterium]|nr:hypothetical protein [Gemmatimonadota bacterium]
MAVHVITGGQANEARLHTRLEPTEVGIASYTLRLVDLLPYPVADPTMDAPAPQLWLRLVPAGAN